MQGYEDVKMLQDAEEIADDVWRLVAKWDRFARDTVAGQFVRAVDSVGANIAESYGRFHYGEKIQFLYYARGSVFETKYWLNRAFKRKLITEDVYQTYTDSLTAIARQINGFSRHLKARRSDKNSPSALRESGPDYLVPDESTDEIIFSELQLTWIAFNQDSDLTILQAIRTDSSHTSFL